MNDILRIARLRIALQRAFLGRAILIFTFNTCLEKFAKKSSNFVRYSSESKKERVVSQIIYNRQHNTKPLSEKVLKASFQ